MLQLKDYKMIMDEVLLPSQSKMLKEVRNLVKDSALRGYKKMEVVDGGVVYYVDDGKKRPMLCVHLDTINTHYSTAKIKSKDIVYNEGVYALSPTADKDLQCLGGDDRCGISIIYALLIKELLQGIKLENRAYNYGFFLNEEIGAVGSSNCCKLNFHKFTNMFIGLDRRGAKEFATYEVSSTSLNNILINRGYKEVTGTYSDCSILSEATELPCINLAVGYYNEHTRQEFVKLEVVEEVVNLLNDKQLQQQLLNWEWDYEVDGDPILRHYYYRNFGSHYSEMGYDQDTAEVDTIFGYDDKIYKYNPQTLEYEEV